MPTNIDRYLNQIRTAVYGKQVRSAIADGIEECYNRDIQDNPLIIRKEVLATEFNANDDYLKGELVFYEGDIYIFTADHSAGAWKTDNPDAVVIPLADAIETKADKADTVLDTTLSRGRKADTTVGLNSFAFGEDVTASHRLTAAFGFQTIAGSMMSFATGRLSQATGRASHAEGEETTASGAQSHAEGYLSVASQYRAHAEGDSTTASGACSHAEGSSTTASGHYSHAEGKDTVASEHNSHAEGILTQATNTSAHAEGYGFQEKGLGSQMVDRPVIASGIGSHAEGKATKATGDAAHSEGERTEAQGSSSHAEGGFSYAIGIASHAEGNANSASGYAAHAEGIMTYAGGDYSHTEGNTTIASDSCSHAEGQETEASGPCSHAEGNTTIASGNHSHAQGSYTEASGDVAHAEGYYSVASGSYCHAEGNNTISNHRAQHVFGECNVEDNNAANSNVRGTYVEIVGNGANTNNRSNARTLDWNGNERLAGDLTLNMGTNNEVSVLTALTTLQNQMADLLYEAIKFNSCTVTPSLALIGTTVSSVTIAWDLNKLPTTLKLDNVAVPSNKLIQNGSMEKTGTWTATTTFTMAATDERDTAITSKPKLTFGKNVYYGVADLNNNPNSAFVTGLTAELRTNKKPSFIVNAGTNKYVYYAVPTSYGACTFAVGGFSGGFEAAKTVSVTYPNTSHTENYYVYRSTNNSLGSTTITVS